MLDAFMSNMRLWLEFVSGEIAALQSPRVLVFLFFLILISYGHRPLPRQCMKVKGGADIWGDGT